MKARASDAETRGVHAEIIPQNRGKEIPISAPPIALSATGKSPDAREGGNGCLMMSNAARWRALRKPRPPAGGLRSALRKRARPRAAYKIPLRFCRCEDPPKIRPPSRPRAEISAIGSPRRKRASLMARRGRRSDRFRRQLRPSARCRRERRSGCPRSRWRAAPHPRSCARRSRRARRRSPWCWPER